jgi:CHRD domain-containing protein
MKSRAALLVGVIALAAAPIAAAQNWQRIGTNLIGYQEVPAVSTTGNGTFDARISQDESEIEYVLSYSDLQGAVQQAHIHFGQLSVNGGISTFLCSNLGNGPAGTQPCPPSPATVSGTIRATDIIGPAAQGITAGQLAELIAAIRAGVAYANVHSTTWPGGEIRGQLGAGHSH